MSRRRKNIPGRITCLKALSQERDQSVLEIENTVCLGQHGWGRWQEGETFRNIGRSWGVLPGCVKNFAFKGKDVGNILKDLWQSSNV